MSRPETLLTFSDYIEDFKARVEIHNFEVQKLREDIKFLFDYLMDGVFFKVVNKWYNREGNLPLYLPMGYNNIVTHLQIAPLL